MFSDLIAAVLLMVTSAISKPTVVPVSNLTNNLPAALTVTSAFSKPTVAPVSNLTKTSSTFREFIEKFDPSTVWEQMDRHRLLRGVNNSAQEEFDSFFKGIDPTDELLSLPVPKGDTRIVVEKSGRRWQPPGELMYRHPHDPWSLRHRLYNLMKQALYQARNKMIIMQELREETRKSALYKMGFLFAKTDLMAKTFASVAKKSFRACSMKQQYKYGAPQHKYFFIDIVYTHERLMQLWFDLDLMVDIIERNDYIGKRVLSKYGGPDRVKAFNKLFEN